MSEMAVQLEPKPHGYYEGRPVSELGLKLRQIREQIEAAAHRGELKLLNKDELEQEVQDLRPVDSDLS
jgi:hypothetical protein